MSTQSSTTLRIWTFRCVAILLGLIPFVIAEAALRFATNETRWANAPAPQIEFDQVRPLFVLDDASGRYVIPKTRQPFFKPDSFAAQKGSSEFRIFCFGGSTVQGNPYSTQTAFTTWLKLSLEAADPTRDWQVINCGGISYASYRLAPIFYECLRYQPDLMILYLGDNEFLEERHYVAPRDEARWIRSFAQLRLVQSVQTFYGRLGTGRPEVSSSEPIKLSTEVQALLDYRGGLEKYHRDDAWRRGVVEHFRATVEQMIAAARDVRVPVYLLDPVANIKDCAPFKIEISKSLADVELRALEDYLNRAHDPAIGRAEQIELLRAALKIDPRHAGAWYALGRALLEAGDIDQAREALFRAKDEDVCPLRIIEPLRKVIYEVVRQHDVPLVPVMKLFEQQSPQGIPGDELLLDHVHPSITGHQMIADLLCATMIERDLVQPRADWKAKRERLYAKHLAKLDTPYFARGQEHLEGLRKWAQGRVTKLPPSNEQN